MESRKWVNFKIQRWAVSMLRFAYYLTGVLAILMFILPFYAWFVYLKPQFGYLLTGPESFYVALVAIAYGLFFLIVTAVLVVLQSLGEKLILDH